MRLYLLLVLGIVLFGCTSNQVSLGELSKNPQPYVNKTIEVQGTTLLYDNSIGGTDAFAGTVPFEWAIQDDQGYKILINPLPEANRRVYSYKKISITGVLNEICNCENNVTSVYEPVVDCSFNKNDSTVSFSFYDPTNLTEEIHFIILQVDDYWVPYLNSEPTGQVIYNKTVIGSVGNHSSRISLGNHQYSCQITVNRPQYSVTEAKISSEQCSAMSNENETFGCKNGTISYYLNATQPYTIIGN